MQVPGVGGGGSLLSPGTRGSQALPAGQWGEVTHVLGLPGTTLFSPAAAHLGGVAVVVPTSVSLCPSIPPPLRTHFCDPGQGVDISETPFAHLHTGLWVLGGAVRDRLRRGVGLEAQSMMI